MALEGVLRRGDAGQLQQRMVGAAQQVPGRLGAGRAVGERLRPGREVSRAGEHALHALLPRAHPPVPVLPRALSGGGPHGPPAPVLVLREQGSGREAQRDARARAIQAVARGARAAHGHAPDRRGRHGRVLRPAQEVARRAEQGAHLRLVG